MASLIHNRPLQYRQRAEEARVRAEAVTDNVQRKSLLQIADTWERRAHYEERHPVFGGLYAPPKPPRGDTQ